jgi:hypothetical protein
MSITPENKVRWTMKNSTGTVKDLDSQTILESGQQYHVAASYDGQFMLLYIDGLLENFTALSGMINASPVDLEIAQILPDDPSYNFGGILDEIKIFDYALLPDSVFAENGNTITAVEGDFSQKDLLFNVYPNPTQHFISLGWNGLHENENATTTYQLFNMLGQEKMNGELFSQKIQTIDLSPLSAGCYILHVQRGSQQGNKLIWLIQART